MKFEAKIDKKTGILHVPCKVEKKANGSIVVHAPSGNSIKEAVDKFKEKNNG